VTRNDLVWLALIVIGATAFAVWCFWADAASDAEDAIDRELREMLEARP